MARKKTSTVKEEDHGSKIIYLKRNGNPTRLDEEMYDGAVTKIGSRFEGRSPMSAFSIEERDKEKYYLALKQGMDVEARDFNRIRNEFWNDFTISVPGGEGLKLEIGLDEDGEPLNIDDYVTWKYAVKCREVAEDKADADDRSNVLFYINDPGYENRIKHSKMVTKMKINGYLMELFSNKAESKNKLNQVLRVMGEKPESFKLEEDKHLKLNELIFEKNKASLFMSAYEDDNIELRALIHDLHDKNVIAKSKNTYHEGDEELGTVDDLIAMLKSPTESDRLMRYKSLVKV
tara:strand:- start:285 stop:1154 length:870 start_codon:yes stop_codon:yes gene_type:complete